MWNISLSFKVLTTIPPKNPTNRPQTTYSRKPSTNIITIRTTQFPVNIPLTTTTGKRSTTQRMQIEKPKKREGLAKTDKDLRKQIKEVCAEIIEKGTSWTDLDDTIKGVLTSLLDRLSGRLAHIEEVEDNTDTNIQDNENLPPVIEKKLRRSFRIGKAPQRYGFY
ncbi:Hypothetical predicted protein [Mytilus galloprovincialis]|uniref:Uncharacterized protein n=1 Tax=Mytilus galloprovincialis TaxID=29158 RepID=A0A8B6FXJ7_MYTGA|nr:Hypothetical predicted protein [Mytilus galloprovincialis]